jgi:hypothetical protein
VNIVECINDPNLLGQWFDGPLWDGWKAVLKGAFGIRMNDDERAFFRSVAQRDPPRKRVREVWSIAGRRAGKDSIASAIDVWFLAFEDFQSRLRPGEAASVISIASDREQAKLLLKYTAAYFANVPMLGALVTREHSDGLELTNRSELVVLASSYRSVRGRSVACGNLNEVAFLRSETSASPDVEVYNALVPGMATLPGSMLVGISSPHKRSGLLYSVWKESFSKDDDDVLVVQGASRTFNPELPQRVVDEYMAKDPAKARAEWLGEWRDDLAEYLPRALIEAAVDDGVAVRPPVPRVQYSAFADPSGGQSDSFTCAIAHVEGDMVLLDCLIEIVPPFNPNEATNDIARTLNQYGLRKVVGDRYAAGWVVDAFRRGGVEYAHAEIDRSAIYRNCLPLFTAGRVRLLDSRKLVTQFSGLERRTLSGGKERIDHPDVASAHDDLSNAAAGALVLASGVIRDPNAFDIQTFIRAYS